MTEGQRAWGDIRGERKLKSGGGRTKRVRKRVIVPSVTSERNAKGEAGRTHVHTQKRFICQNKHVARPAQANEHGPHTTPSTTHSVCRESPGLSPAGPGGHPWSCGQDLEGRRPSWGPPNTQVCRATPAVPRLPSFKCHGIATCLPASELPGGWHGLLLEQAHYLRPGWHTFAPLRLLLVPPPSFPQEPGLGL